MSEFFSPDIDLQRISPLTNCFAKLPRKFTTEKFGTHKKCPWMHKKGCGRVKMGAGDKKKIEFCCCFANFWAKRKGTDSLITTDYLTDNLKRRAMLLYSSSKVPPINWPRSKEGPGGL